MSQKKNLVGQQFGYLTPIRVSGQDKHKRLIWECICQCGGSKFIDSRSLISGNTKSCGCLNRRGVDGEAGKVYGKLTVISKADALGKWICQCSCGNTIIKRGAELRKNARSCGCNAISGSTHPKWTGFNDIDGRYWNNIQRGAKSRGYAFELDLEYVWELYLQQDKKCALTGCPIDFAYEKEERRVRTASLDRIDNDIGYVKGNVQWVLLEVNYMKRGMSVQKLIALCDKVVKHNQHYSGL